MELPGVREAVLEVIQGLTRRNLPCDTSCMTTTRKIAAPFLFLAYSIALVGCMLGFLFTGVFAICSGKNERVMVVGDKLYSRMECITDRLMNVGRA
jgi:hypothetical protein